MTEHYPEARPDGGFVKFPADLTRIAETRAAVARQRELVERRVDTIIEETLIKGMPVLTPLLGLTRDRADLTTLADALTRLAPLAAALEDLERKQTVLDLAAADPTWFMYAFGALEDVFADLELAEEPRRRGPIALHQPEASPDL